MSSHQNRHGELTKKTTISHPELVSGSVVLSGKILKQVQSDNKHQMSTFFYELFAMTDFCYNLFLRSLKACTIILWVFAFSPFTAHADYISGAFTVTEKSFDFTKDIVSGKCSGQIQYPVLSNEDTEIADEMNYEILDFVHSYVICNQGERSNFSVSFGLPESGSEEYSSIIWITKKDGKIYRIDSINFNMQNADLLQIDDIFNLMSSSVFKEIIKLSDGHLKPDENWEKFLDKIGKRDIQYYLKNGEWHLVFNGTPSLDKVVDVKVPQYFLEGDDVAKAR